MLRISYAACHITLYAECHYVIILSVVMLSVVAPAYLENDHKINVRGFVNTNPG